MQSDPEPGPQRCSRGDRGITAPVLGHMRAGVSLVRALIAEVLWAGWVCVSENAGVNSSFI